jgi:adenylate cyclase
MKPRKIPIRTETLKRFIGGLKLHRFEAGTELAFEDEIRLQCIRSMWFAFPVTIILHLLMPFAARSFFPKPDILVLYHYFIASSCLAGLVLTFWEPYRKNVLNLSIPVWSVCALATVVALIFTDDGIYYYIAAPIYVTLYAGGFIRTTFYRAVVCCALIFGFFNFALYICNFGMRSFVFVDSMMVYAVFIGLSSCFFLEKIERQKFSVEFELKSERDKIDSILHDMLPERIYERVKRGEMNIAESTDRASIAFCDMVGFTHLSSNTRPDLIVSMLNDLFTRLDEIALRHGVEKIKTIGDAYMAAAGVGDAVNKDAYAIARFALEARDEASEVGIRHGFTIKMRFGVATGQVVSGIIGSSRPIFDVWGSTVNLASRLESISTPGSITIDAATASLLTDRFNVRPKGKATAKGIGEVEIFELNLRNE